MKILLIAFLYSNGGDFLFHKRSIDLLQRSFQHHDFQIMSGLDGIDFDILNDMDAIIMSGGPRYDDRIIREHLFPLFGDIDNLRPPIFTLGAGIYGEDCFAAAINEKRFSNDVREFLKKIEHKGGWFGCRDVLSYIVMKNNGLTSVYLTGCPAWYDLEYIDQMHLKQEKKHEINKIVISDPGVTKKKEEQEIRAKQAIEVIEKVKALFPKADIVFTFNNGINTKYSSKCNNMINDYLVKNAIPVYELDHDEKKFQVYDDADLHVGFRVHSHVYCLSRKIFSILIEEDLRGYGMNETLGLPHLLSYNELSMHMEGKYIPNPWLTKQLGEVVEFMEMTSFARLDGTFSTISNIYQNGWMKMIDIIKNSLQIKS